MNYLAIVVPCHRVIRADGSLCGYGGGLWRKQWLLDHERRSFSLSSLRTGFTSEVGKVAGSCVRCSEAKPITAVFHGWGGAQMSSLDAIANSLPTPTGAEHSPLDGNSAILRNSADAMVSRAAAPSAQSPAKDLVRGEHALLPIRADFAAGEALAPQAAPGQQAVATAYVLKEEFGQLWSYRREGGARQFFTRWQEQLKWQRLRPFEKFAALIERHWERHRGVLHTPQQGQAGIRRRSE